MDKVREIILQVEDLKQDKKFEDAISLIQNNLGSYSEDYRLYEELSDIFLYKGYLDKALKAVNFSLELCPESATGNYLKGFILLSKDRIAEAIRYLEISNKFIGNNSEVLRNLGWAYTLSWETERGISILKRALNISPWDELITEDLWMALIGAGEINEWNSLLKKIWKKSKL
jgi:tetratricopeptide (TPR) repeat protein